MYDIGIEQGMVYLDGGFRKANLYITGEQIGAITQEKQPSKRVIDAAGKMVLPGFIDPHVHFALGVGENVSKDDFHDGSVEAAFGGVTTYIDFIDPVKEAGEIKKEFEHRLSMAEQSVVDYAFHSCVANPVSSARELIAESRKYGMNSVKLFTTYSNTDRRTYDSQIYELLKESRKQDAVIVIHAENDDLVDISPHILIKDHEKARPVITETMEVMKLAQLEQEADGNLYIVHVSAGSTVKLLVHNFRKELNAKKIMLESCPHYFLLNSDCLAKEDGYKYTMTPPIRPEKERRLLMEYADEIMTIGTDHCPYTKEQKAHIYTSEVPMGIGGIRYSFLNMYNLFGDAVIDKFTKGPASAYGLTRKGTLLPGMDADVVIFDQSKTTTVEDEMSVYDKKQLRGRIETVLARGEVVVMEDTLYPHTGAYVRRGEQDAGH